MNREQRRKTGSPKEPVYNLTYSQIQQMKIDATNVAIEQAFILMLGLPVYVIHDHYPELMKRNVDGKGREERFTDLILKQWEMYQEGLFTLDDVKQLLNDECGLKFKGELK